jgi:fatty-acyl-CoA synthase
MEIVSCGRALPGTEVKILDADGGNAPDRSVGEIVLRGPSLLSETLGDAEGSPSPEEWFRTGDLGFLVGGELHVSGRAKDLIILRGENHHPAEIEWALAGFEGVREGRVAALGIEDPGLGTETLCLVAERNRRTSLSDEEIVQQIRRRVHERTGLTVAEVELVRSGTIPTTTSGKIQRGLARELFLTSRSPAS